MQSFAISGEQSQKSVKMEATSTLVTAGTSGGYHHHKLSEDSVVANHVQPPPPTFSRLPPDGHEFPPDYRDPSSNIVYQVTKNIACRVQTSPSCLFLSALNFF